MSKIYLAIPFSGIEELSFKCANEVASLLIKQGYYVFSPISHSYPIWKTEMVEHTYDVWLTQDKVFVEWADEVFVVNIVGHEGLERIEKSTGVQKELTWADDWSKKVSIINYNPETKELT
jgi:uncharacterized protein DUF1937